MAFNLMCMIIFWAGFTDFNVSSIKEETPVGDISAYANVIFSKPHKLIITLWAHMFAPLASIFVFIFFVEKYKIDVKSYYKAASPFCIAYLSAWFLINIIKMFIMYGVGVENIMTFKISGDYNTEFQEFYERIRTNNPGFWGDMSVIGYLSGPYFFFNFALEDDIASNGMSLMMGVAFGSVIVTIIMQYVVIGFGNLWIKKNNPDTPISNEYNFIVEKYEGRSFEIIKICFYIITLSAGIFQLTQTNHYINENIGFMYKTAYLIVAVSILLGSMCGIMIALLYILNIYKNPSWTFYISLCVGGLALSFYLIGIPLLIISVFSLWYKSNKKNL
ncbi:hypothetical protein STIUS_v1c05100 [Spiroplasma sp. TIUS-1]|uniref:hypothetical protein n=1 Tax=Spiroplasma sp. TIUS-1 TaxID=216963 RepID=UPI001397689D|nr:hypothetical protein [Spiroplasma sp. TIUS-1]QHX36064.1 hypothetical protein STIUS_v1c05100 [Spiroplasma sp. TIUS-1]